MWRMGYADHFRFHSQMRFWSQETARRLNAAKQALDWLILMKEELGDPWVKNDLFRIGASTLLADIERQLEHFATGRYSAFNRHPMG